MTILQLDGQVAVEIVSVQLDVDPATTDTLGQCLSADERRRASRFAFERDRRRFIVGRAQLRQLLASRLGVRSTDIDLVYGALGKPALSRRFAGTDLRFNISHSEEVALYAFTRDCEIGVDVEVIRELHEADDVVQRFFSPGEQDAYRSLTPRDRPLGFFNCWTRKEAFIKALGDGLQYPLDAFDVSLIPGEPARILRVGAISGEACGWVVHHLAIGPGIVGAVVTQKPIDQKPVRVSARIGTAAMASCRE